MTTKIEQLFWISDSEVEKFNASIRSNLARYRNGNFDDLTMNNGWRERSLFSFDSTPFNKLSGKSSDDLKDAMIIYAQLDQLKPSLASSRNVWIGLIHTHLLKFSRKRWFDNVTDDETLIKRIREHVFAGTVGGIRDDNAVARPWWTGYVGQRTSKTKSIPEIEKALSSFMRTTDTRSNWIERTGIFTEQVLANSISNYLLLGKHNDAATEQYAFRAFMKSINLYSNGRYFGDMDTPEIFEFLDSCKQKQEAVKTGIA